jgi:hypothetical protein
VNGPAPCSVSARPAAWTAASSVVKLPASVATCTMFLVLPGVPFCGPFCIGVVMGWCSCCRVVGAARLVHGEGDTTITARQRADRPGFVSMDCPAIIPADCLVV